MLKAASGQRILLVGQSYGAAIATLMARLNERPVTAFTCGFEAAGAKDERAQAERVARALNLDWRETTFGEDIADAHALKAILRTLAEKVSRRLKRAKMAGVTVTLKLKTADFRIRTRSRQLTDPTQLADRIFAVGADMLAGEADGTRFRLIGIGVSALNETDGADFADLIDRRNAEAERAMDRLRDRFGDAAVVKGLTIERSSDAEE